MFVELAIDAMLLAAALASRARSECWCLGGTPFPVISGLTDKESIIDHVDLGGFAVLSRGSATSTMITLPSGAKASVAGTGVQVEISVLITLKLPLKAIDPAHTDEIYKQLPFILIADLTSSGSQVCADKFKLTQPPPSSLPPIPLSVLLKPSSKFKPPICGNTGLGKLKDVLGVGDPINSGLFLSADDSRLFLRLQLDQPLYLDDSFIRVWWEQFFSGSVAAFEAGDNFSLYVDGGLIANGFVNRIKTPLEQGAMNADATYFVKQAPVGAWDQAGYGEIDANFTVDLFNVCPITNGDISVTINAIAPVSLPEPDTIHIYVKATWDVSQSDIIWCALSVGRIVDLFVLGKNVAPTTSQLQAFNIAGCSAPEIHKDYISFECDFDVALPDLTLGTATSYASFEIDHLTPNNEGLILSGPLTLHNDGTYGPFGMVGDCAWGWSGGCDDYHYGLNCEILLGPGGFACTATIVNGTDSLGVFSVGEGEYVPNGYKIPVIFNPAPDAEGAYWQNPYPCVVFVTTPNWSRAIALQIPTPPKLTQQTEIEMIEAIATNKQTCSAPATGLFGIAGRFDFNWIPDPAPEGVTQLWRVGLEGLAKGESIHVETAGRMLVTVAGRGGMATDFGFLRGQGESGLLTLVRRRAEQITARAGKDSVPRVAIKQVPLIQQRVIPFSDPVTGMASLLVGNRRALLLANAGGVEAFDIGRPQVPARMFSWDRPQTDGIARVTSDKITIWGRDWLQVVSMRDSSVKPVEWRGLRAVAVAAGTIYVVDDRGLTVLDDELRRVHLVEIEGVIDVVVNRGQVTLASETALAFLDSDPLPTTVSWIKYGGGRILELLVPKMVNNAGLVFIRTMGETGGAIVSQTENGRLEQLASYAEAPWFAHTLELGKLLISIENDGRSLAIYSISTATAVADNSPPEHRMVVAPGLRREAA